MKRTAPSYIPTLDGWRAIAILAVMVCHGEEYFFSSVGLYPSPRIHAYLFHGARGVSIFFCLSGFLICTLLLNEYNSTGSINLRGFYVRRAFRILPPYWSYLATLVILALLGFIAVPRNDILASLLFVRNYVRGGDWYTIHFWTLAVEEHFYLLLPVILVFAKGRKSLAILLSLTILSTGLRSWTENLPEGFGVAKWDGDAFINELLTGALAAVLITFPSPRKWLSQFPLWLWFVLLLSTIYSEVRPREPFLLHVLQPVIFTLLIVTTSLRPDSLPARFLELKWLRQIGVMSYGLYVWQELFLTNESVSKLPLGVLQRWPVSWLMLVAVATLSFVVVEKPLMRYGRNLSHRVVVSSQQNGTISEGIIQPVE